MLRKPDRPQFPSELCHSELTSWASHLIWGISKTVASLLSRPPPEPKADITNQSRTFSLMDRKQGSSSFLRLAAISMQGGQKRPSLPGLWNLTMKARFFIYMGTDDISLAELLGVH